MELYQEAISLFCDMGRFANAAKLEKEIGEEMSKLEELLEQE